jgi:hypothetical protein
MRGRKLPQIWMTYGEIASMMGCDPARVREIAIEKKLDRKQSRDGCARVKLDVAWTAIFIARIREADGALDQAIHGLQDVHRKMSHPNEIRARA